MCLYRWKLKILDPECNGTILEYFLIPLFESFNEGNENVILLFESYRGQKNFPSDKWDLYWARGLNQNSTMGLMHSPKAIGEDPKNSLYFMP